MKKRLKKKRYVVKIGNSGFTLIELLAVVAILAVVASIVIYFSLRVVNDANEKSYATTINNIEDEANNYILENGDGNSWMPTDVEDNQYQCVTVQNLIDIGYFKSDVLKSKVDKNTYVDKDDYIYVERNKNNVITKSVLLVGDDVDTSYLNLCGRINTYVVTYDENGGSGAPDSQTKTKDVNLTLSSVKPTKSGFRFVSWNTKSDGSGTSYNPGDTYDKNLSITLYAQWGSNKVYITYDANLNKASLRVSNLPSIQEKIVGDDTELSSMIPVSINKSNGSQNSNYAFAGWNTKADGSGVYYTPGGKSNFFGDTDTYTGDDDITLYAQWHIFDAIGVTIFRISTSWGKFHCHDKEHDFHYHSAAFGVYCSKCEMSGKYYKSKVNSSFVGGSLACPCTPSYSKVFDDSGLQNSWSYNSKLSVYNGIYYGKSPLPLYSGTLPRECGEH